MSVQCCPLFDVSRNVLDHHVVSVYVYGLEPNYKLFERRLSLIVVSSEHKNVRIVNF